MDNSYIIFLNAIFCDNNVWENIDFSLLLMEAIIQ